jgi:hypothetical protein
MNPTQIRSPSFTGGWLQHEGSPSSTPASPKRHTPAQPPQERPDGLGPRRAAAAQTTATDRPRTTLPKVEVGTAKFSDLPTHLVLDITERLDATSAMTFANVSQGNRHAILPAVVDKITQAQSERLVAARTSHERDGILSALVKAVGQLPAEHRADRLLSVASWLSLSGPGGASVHAVLAASKGLSADQRREVFDTVLEQVKYDSSHLHLLSKAVWAHPHERPADEMLKIVRSFDNVRADGYAEAYLRDIISELPVSKIGSDKRKALVTQLLRQGERINPTPWIGKLWHMVCDANDPKLLQESFNPLLTLLRERVRQFDGDVASKSPLKGMAERLGDLPETELRSAWSQMKAVVRFTPKLVPGPCRVGVLAGLMEAVPRLAPGMQGEAAELIKGYWPESSKGVAKLASAIPDLREDVRQRAFDAVVSCLEEAEAHLNPSAPRPKSMTIMQMTRLGLLADPAASQAALAEAGGMAGMLVQMSRAAGALPDLAPRAAVDQVLKRLQHIKDPSSRAEVLQSLAREALPAVLERPVDLGIPTQRHVSRDALLQSFAKQIKELPLDRRIPVLKEMLRDTEAQASGSTSFLSRNKSGKLPALLRKLLKSATS